MDTSQEPTASSQQPPRARRGGRVACCFCHARRIRCNAFESQPCSNCVSAQIPCQLIESRRGRYVRSHLKHVSKPHVAETVASIAKPSQATRGAIASRHAPSPLPPLPQDFTFDSTSDLDSDSIATGFQMVNSRGVYQLSQLVSSQMLKEGSEMLYARLSELQLSPSESQNLQGTQLLYLGESWLLTYVIQEVADGQTDSSSGSPSALQVPVPSSIDCKQEDVGCNSRDDPINIEILKMKDALALPEKEISDKLIHVFFEYVYPAFPIFDRKEFSHLYETQQMPLLILNAIYSLASTLCDNDVIVKAGFPDHCTARKVFLKRTRAHYDADYETNKVTLVQAAFLLSFLWNGSMDNKDMWHWLGVSISAAQSKGLHRSTVHSRLRIQERRLWKRIWWSLYVRDRHCAANIGLPMRIRDDDCDVEELEESDFEDELENGSHIYGERRITHTTYAISMAKLSTIFGNIILTKYPGSKSRVTLSRTELDLQLSTWRQQLLEINYSEDINGDRLWSSMLELSYNYLLILLHRPEPGSLTRSGDTSQNLAFSSANKITRIVDDLLAIGLLKQAQLQICPILFAALSMYVLMVRRFDRIQRKLAENKAGLLILACTEVSKTWPACGWILRLFETIFKNLEEKGWQTLLNQTKDTLYKARNYPEGHLPNEAAESENDIGNIEQHAVPGYPAATACQNDATEPFSFDAQFMPFLDMPGVFDSDLLNGFSMDVDDQTVRPTM
ncbi:fungal-specific transcription factor domain-containing protein [Xylogone sp. PMI_703]|nr:fungal-specific transcription factor domain-containing protein [Xylogone sp. PMI_703]